MDTLEIAVAVSLLLGIQGIVILKLAKMFLKELENNRVLNKAENIEQYRDITSTVDTPTQEKEDEPLETITGEDEDLIDFQDLEIEDLEELKIKEGDLEFEKQESKK